MKKILTILLAFVLIFSFAACNDSGADASNPSGGESTEQGGGTDGGGTQKPDEGEGDGGGTQKPDEGEGDGGGTQKPDEGEGDGGGTQKPDEGEDEGGGTQKPDEGEGDGGGTQKPDEGEDEGGGTQKPDEGDGDGGGTQKPDEDDKDPDPSLAGKALSIVKNFLAKKLDVWEYVPSALKPENMVQDNVPTDFNTDFVQVSTIGRKAIGKQLNVVYDIFGYVETISGYLDTVIAAQDAIVDAYQLFINDNPDNYALFEKKMEHFDLKIQLTDTQNVLLVRLATAAIEIYYDDAAKASTVRVQISDGNVLKYETSEGHLKAALSIMNVAKWQVEFDANDEGGVDGRLYEFYGVAGKYLKTVADYHMDENYTYIIADKRETDDLIIEGSLEAYDNRTGELVGSKVKETVKKKDYDTQWFNLYDVTGIVSVKKVDKQNVMNADTIYINGSSESLHSKTVALLDASRRFDIEFKEVWYYQTGEDGKLEKVKTEIPMLFVQEANIETFEEDFEDENKVTVTLSPKFGTSKVTEAYEAYVEAYAADKQLVTVDEIDTYIGTKNAFFG